MVHALQTLVTLRKGLKIRMGNAWKMMDKKNVLFYVVLIVGKTLNGDVDIIPCDSPVTAKGTFACDDDHIITDKVCTQ